MPAPGIIMPVWIKRHGVLNCLSSAMACIGHSCAGPRWLPLDMEASTASGPLRARRCVSRGRAPRSIAEHGRRKSAEKREKTDADALGVHETEGLLRARRCVSPEHRGARRSTAEQSRRKAASGAREEDAPSPWTRAAPP